jgi:hypothetical protein
MISESPTGVKEETSVCETNVSSTAEAHSNTKESAVGGFEWKSRVGFRGIPLVHVVYGSDPEGKIRVAKGFIAIGRFGVGAITIAQFGVGFILGIGQAVFGLFAVGQLAIGLLAGIGQLSVGLIAVGQLFIGIYGVGQAGWAKYMWSPSRVDMEAVAMIHTILTKIGNLFGIRLI